MQNQSKKQTGGPSQGTTSKRKAKPVNRNRNAGRATHARAQKGGGGKRAVEIIVSVALVAAVGYGFFHTYRSMEPISQDTENMNLMAEDAEASTESTAEQTVYESVAVDNSQVNAGDLILVNEENAYVENNSAEIVSIYEKKTENYHVSGTDTSLREPAVDALNQMLDDFYVATGHSDIIVISGYRTKEQQQELYDEDLAETGQSTSTRVAEPGHSEHESGYSLDVSLYEDGIQSDYDGTGDYAWINENCSHYGYVLRYTEEKADITNIQAEPWHYRYVGQPHATYMMENNVCLEEYLTLLKSYTSDNRLQIANWDGEIYEVYYVAADTAADSTYVLVPPDQSYTISGNNSDGFIVTVDTGQIQSFEASDAAETTDAAATDTTDTADIAQTDTTDAVVAEDGEDEAVG